MCMLHVCVPCVRYIYALHMCVKCVCYVYICVNIVCVFYVCVLSLFYVCAKFVCLFDFIVCAFPLFVCLTSSTKYATVKGTFMRAVFVLVTYTPDHSGQYVWDYIS